MLCNESLSPALILFNIESYAKKEKNRTPLPKIETNKTCIGKEEINISKFFRKYYLLHRGLNRFMVKPKNEFNRFETQKSKPFKCTNDEHLENIIRKRVHS